MLRSNLPQIAKTLDTDLEPVIEQAAKNIARGAAERAPRGATGDLAKGYRAEKVAEGWAVMAIWRYYLTEFGTSHSPAEPHLIPAVEVERTKLHDAKIPSVGKAVI